MVKSGVIIPALDGFEEMLVETASGEAVSALGNLVRLLESSGSLLISAREAYFDYKGLNTQVRLYDTLASGEVAFEAEGALVAVRIHWVRIVFETESRIDFTSRAFADSE